MAKTFRTRLLTPAGSLFEGDVKGVQVPGKKGMFEMLVNHAPIMSALEIGRVKIRLEDDSEELYAIGGGFLELSNNSLTVLAESAEPVSEIDVERAQKARDQASEQIKKKTTDREEAEKALARAENRLKLAGE